MGDFVAYPPTVIKAEGAITSIRMNSDGQEIFVGLGNGRLRSYDAATGLQLAELEKFAGPVLSIAISSSDDVLIAADRTGTACEWRREGRQWKLGRTTHLLGRTTHLPDNQISVYLSPHGELIAWLKGPALELWDAATGAKLRSLRTEPDWTMQNVAFDIPNRRMVGGYVNEQTDTGGWAVWHIDTGERLLPVEMPTLGGTYPNDIDITTDGARMAIGFDQALLVNDLNDLQRTNHYGIDSIRAVAFCPTRPYLAAMNASGSITVWNSVTNRPLATLSLPRQRNRPDCLSFSSDGMHLAASNADTVQVWNLQKASEKTVMTGHNGGIPCATFDPTGSVLATGGKDNEVRFWNSTSGRLIRPFSLKEAVQSLAFSADGGLLAVGCMGKNGAPHFRLIDASSNEIVHEAEVPMGTVNSLSWAETLEGRYLAGCGEKGVALWKVSRDHPLTVEEVFALERNRCLAILLHRDAAMMVWVEDDSRLQAWDITAKHQIPLNAPPMLQGWHSMAFLPDQKSIIYVTKSGIAEIWNVQEDREVKFLGAPGTFNESIIALSLDGRWFAALTQPGTVSVWHLPTKKHEFSFRPVAGSVWSLAWDPASEQLAVGQLDGGLSVWHLPLIQQKLAKSGLEWQDN